MKFLRFSFCHPVKGHANLIQLFGDDPQMQRVEIDSKDTNLIEIPVGECADGKWKAVLEWEHDGESYMHQKEFEIMEHKKTYFFDL